MGQPCISQRRSQTKINNYRLAYKIKRKETEWEVISEENEQNVFAHIKRLHEKILKSTLLIFQTFKKNGRRKKKDKE